MIHNCFQIYSSWHRPQGDFLGYRLNVFSFYFFASFWAVILPRQGDVVLPTHLPQLSGSTLEVGNGEDLRPKLASADVDARVFGLQAFLQNPSHALESAAKATERRKSRLSVIGRALGSVRTREPPSSPSLAALSESLALISGLLKRTKNSQALGARGSTTTAVARSGQLEEVIQALDLALSFSQELPSPLENGSEAENRDDFYNFLEKLLAKIRDTAEKPGSILIIPCSAADVQLSIFFKTIMYSDILSGMYIKANAPWFDCFESCMRWVAKKEKFRR